ncbi:MAG: response regulator transcription factor [Fibrobacteres bacterium]|nr:response regulator transcription factor [Fibrobacterota bacterium]
MNPSERPEILLITDDAADESNVSHILGKYQFANSLVKLHGPAEALKYLAAREAPGKSLADPGPELILIGVREPGPSRLSWLKEWRRGPLAGVPLIFLVDSTEAEAEFRKLNLPLSICVTRPIGFFKLLEAMQKLRMRWVVLKP